jgi:putative addiction module CopG family antidote
MKDWVEAQARTGRYSNASDYVRDLIRRDQTRSDKIVAMQRFVDDGLKSGVGSRSKDELFAAAANNAFSLSVEAEEDIIAFTEQGIRMFGTLQARRYHDDLFAVLELVAANPGMAREREEISPPVRIHPFKSPSDCLPHRRERNHFRDSNTPWT